MSFRGSSGRETVLGEALVGASAMRHWNVVTPGGEVVGRIRSNGSRRFYWKDHLGSIRAVSDSAGVVVERHDYDAWGSELAGRSVVESVTSRERFTGHAWDAETEWLYAGARLYDPYIGRWMKQYASAYVYSGNAPTMLVDPDGMLADPGQQAPDQSCDPKLRCWAQAIDQKVDLTGDALIIAGN